MGESSRIFAFLAEQMADCDTQWSLGTFGAIAEFSRDPDEPVTLACAERQVSAITARGAIAIALQEEMRPVASESLTNSSWNQRVALCLPQERCAMHRRGVLTELGSDADALREQDRKAVLFDLGLEALQADFCVRIAGPAIAAALRAHVGRSVFQAGNPAMAIILRANPHRVFMSRLGRIEVYQPIPPMNGVSPEGPHTHVLPKLLQHRRTHPATEAIPEGWTPCAHVYPAHATKDGMGGTRTFDPARHNAFHRLLIEFGDPELIRLKQRVIAAVAGAQAPPLSIAEPLRARQHPGGAAAAAGAARTAAGAHGLARRLRARRRRRSRPGRLRRSARRSLAHGAHHEIVMPGLVPASMSCLRRDAKKRRGWPGQARP